MLYAKYKSLNNKVHRVCFITFRGYSPISIFFGGREQNMKNSWKQQPQKMKCNLSKPMIGMWPKFFFLVLHLKSNSWALWKASQKSLRSSVSFFYITHYRKNSLDGSLHPFHFGLLDHSLMSNFPMKSLTEHWKMIFFFSYILVFMWYKVTRWINNAVQCSNQILVGVSKKWYNGIFFADGAFEEKEIIQFVELNKFPLITVFTDLNSGKVYGSPIKLQVGTLCFSHCMNKWNWIEVIFLEDQRMQQTM